MFNFTFNSKTTYFLYKATWKLRLQEANQDLRKLREQHLEAQRQYAKLDVLGCSDYNVYFSIPREQREARHDAWREMFKIEAKVTEAALKITELHSERQASKLQAKLQMEART
jgi:hypothetical protein